MLFLSITIASSVTIYLIYLIFYPISCKTEKVLNKIDSTIKIILVYTILLVVLIADLYTQDLKVAGTPLLLILLSIIFILLILTPLIYQCGESFEIGVVRITSLFVIFTIFIDFFFLTTHSSTFWLPFFILITIFVITYVLRMLALPEDCNGPYRYSRYL